MVLFIIILACLIVGIPSFIIYNSSYGSLAYTHIKKVNSVIILFHCIFALIIVLISFLFQVYIYKVDKKEKISDNPSNFTIMVTNLPQNTEYNELRDEIERELNGNKEKNRDNLDFQIVDISFGYKIGKFVKDCRDYEDVKEMLDKNTETHLTTCLIFKKSRKDLEKKKNLLEKKIKDFLNGHKDFKKTTYAFITFKTISQKIRVKLLYKMNIFRKLIYFVAMLLCIKRNNPYKKGKLNIKSAPDPSDIIWHNLSASPCERFLRTFTSLIIGSFIIGVSLLLIYILQLIQFQNRIENSSGSTEFRIFISLVIMIFNLILSYVFDLLGKYECHNSYTSMKISVMKKSLIFTTANTVLSFLLILFLIIF